jgi:NADPH:quinone reductase
LRGRTGGVDLALEMSGGPIFEATFAALKFRGRMVIFGNASDIRVAIKPENLLRKALTVKEWFLPPFLADRPLIDRTLKSLASYVQEGRLKPHVGGLYPLSKAGLAHTAIENRASTGKLIIQPFAA